MAVKRVAVGWAFWLQWLVANMLGFSSGFALGRGLALAFVVFFGAFGAFAAAVHGYIGAPWSPAGPH